MSLHDINEDGIPELFLGYWRVAMVYTYGGYGTGVASSCLYEMIDDEIIDNFDGEIYIYYQFSGMIEVPPEAEYYTHDTKITEEEYYFLIDEYFNKNNQILVYVIDNITTNINNMFIDYLNLQ